MDDCLWKSGSQDLLTSSVISDLLHMLNCLQLSVCHRNRESAVLYIYLLYHPLVLHHRVLSEVCFTLLVQEAKQSISTAEANRNFFLAKELLTQLLLDKVMISLPNLVNLILNIYKVFDTILKLSATSLH